MLVVLLLALIEKVIGETSCFSEQNSTQKSETNCKNLCRIHKKYFMKLLKNSEQKKQMAHEFIQEFRFRLFALIAKTIG